MKRLLYGLSACAVGLILAAPLGALGYSHDEGGFRWDYDVYEEDGGWTASIYQVYQLDENGKVKVDEYWDPVYDATTMVVPATLPAVGTNEYAVAEAVYDEDGTFLSNKYTTVYGPEVKSISAVVTYVDAGNEGNDKLTSVTIPETVEKVEGFADCTSLATVAIGPDTEFSHWSFAKTPWLKAQGEFVIRDGVLVAYQGNATEVVVPDGVKRIGDYAFYADSNAEMAKLARVVIPVGLEEIGIGAFEGCSALTSVNLPDSLRRIEDYAFEDCQSLAGVALPTGLRYLGDGAFYRCEALPTIAVPGNVKYVSDYAFYCCTGLTSVVLSEGLRSIGGQAFLGAGLAAIDIPASVEEIEGAAFAYCASLRSLIAWKTTLSGSARL